MSKYIKSILAGSLLASLLLTGCAASNEAAGDSPDQAVQGGRPAAAEQAPSAREGGNGFANRAMNFGKIKDINGSTITIFTAEMPAGRPQNTGGGDAGGAQNGGEQSGSAANVGMQGGRQGGGGQRGSMQQSFSTETTDITVSADTQLNTIIMDNGNRQENAIGLTDLKADDIIQYTLKTGTTEAASITLSNGNFGGGMQGAGEASGSK